MLHFKSALLACGLAASLAGCHESFYDFRVFDDLEDTTRVDSSGVPGALDSRFYGVAMAGGGPAGDGSGVFVAGRNPDGFAGLRYGADGARKTGVIELLEIGNTPPLNGYTSDPVMAGDVAQARVAVAATAGGTPDAPQEAVVLLFDSDTGAVLDSPRIALPGATGIDAMAFGTTTVAGVAGGARNLAVLRGSSLTVVRDVDSPAADEPFCHHQGAESLGIVAGDVVAAAAMDEIVFAEPGAADLGEVHIIAGSLVSDAHADFVDTPVLCFEPGVRAPLLSLTPPNGAGPEFGGVMVTGNFNGQGGLDLAVAGGGGNAVYVYLDLDPAVEPTPITIAAPPGAALFGATLAAGDLDGGDDRPDELVIGAPGASAGGKDGAGSVFIYRLAGAAFEELATFHDAQPETGQKYGQSLAVVPFGADRAMLLVGADQEVFAYFRTPLSDDVRAGR